MCADPNCAHSRKYPHGDSCPIGPLVILLPLHRTPGTTVNMDLAQNSTNTLVCVQIVLVQIFCNIAKVEIFKCEWRVFLETVTTYSRLIKSCKCIFYYPESSIIVLTLLASKYCCYSQLFDMIYSMTKRYIFKSFK